MLLLLLLQLQLYKLCLVYVFAFVFFSGLTVFAPAAAEAIVCVCGCSTHISLPSGGWVPVYVSIFHDFSCAEKRFYYFYVLSLNIFLLRVRIIYGHIQCSVARCSFSAFFAVIRVREKESEIEFGFSPFHYTVKYRPISYNKCMRMLNNNCP